MLALLYAALLAWIILSFWDRGDGGGLDSSDRKW